MPILVASNAQSVSLHLDGHEIARAPVHEGAARFRPVYAPGRLVARAWRDGALVAESACETTGPAVALRLIPDRTRITGGCILGMGNGDPNLALSEAPASDGRSAALALFNGLAQAIVCGESAAGNTLELVARAATLAPARCAVQVDPQRGATQPADPAARWVLLHVSFTPRRAVAAAGGTLRFASLAGRAEIWLDGTRIAAKGDPAPGPLSLPFPPGTGERQLDVLFDTLGSPAQSGARFAIAGTVSLAPLR